MKPTQITAAANVITVSQLNRQARLLLETELPALCVCGELSNFSRPSSGHWYFSLKDAQAQVRCAMFRNRNQLLGFQPDNGVQVLARGKISLYEGRGDFQLIVDSLEPYGDGVLAQQFEKLKQELHALGWFEASLKQALPKFPKRIGIITSPTGAAIRDILHVLKRRLPMLPVIIYPTAVQGRQAAAEIARTLELANQHQACDCLILARGGGSLEDLWAFNESIVATAIHHSQIPIISGIGHEIDTTIADFVADLRAPTPSAAAEMATPDSQQLKHQLERLQARLIQHIDHALQSRRLQLVHLQKRLKSPQQHLQQLSQQFDNLEVRLRQAWQRYLERQRAQLANLARALNAVSPLATLERGYAIVTTPDEKLLQSITECQVDQLVHTRLSDGRLTCRVTAIKADSILKS
jgi:exodeoxyribonuclease VII large subunit